MKKRQDTVVKRIHIRHPTATDIIDRVLDKGIVIDCHVDRVSVSGIDLPVTVDVRYVVASFDTYLEYAEPLRKAGLLETLQDLTVE